MFICFTSFSTSYILNEHTIIVRIENGDDEKQPEQLCAMMEIS